VLTATFLAILSLSVKEEQRLVGANIFRNYSGKSTARFLLMPTTADCHDLFSLMLQALLDQDAVSLVLSAMDNHSEAIDILVGGVLALAA